MHHISPERLAALADGQPAADAETRHLGLCRACRDEVARTVSLIAALHSLDEPPMPHERLEHNAVLIDRRIASLALVPRRARLRWVLLPMAAAAALVFMPQSRDAGHGSRALMSKGEQDLSAEEYDELVQTLAGPMEDLQVVQQILDRRAAPMSILAGLTGDELKSLLGLLDNGRG